MEGEELTGGGEGAGTKLILQHQTWDWGKVKKEENDAGGLGAAVGPQWGPGAKPLVGVWGQHPPPPPPKAEGFFQYVITKSSILEHENQVFTKSASFMSRPDIYLVILKIALKMSLWCSKNKILAKVLNHLTATVRSSPKVGILQLKKKKKKEREREIYIYIYILAQQQNIFWYRYSILFNLSATTQRKATMCQTWED